MQHNREAVATNAGQIHALDWVRFGNALIDALGEAGHDLNRDCPDCGEPDGSSLIISGEE